jgi:hypothetical protein
LARGSPSTSAVPALRQGAHRQPRQHQPHPHQQFSEGLAIDLDDIDSTFTNTSTRGSPLTSVVPTLRQVALHRPRRHRPHPRQQFSKGLAFNLGDINFTLTNTSSAPHAWVEDLHPSLAPSAPSTSPLFHLSTSASTSPPPGYLRTKDSPSSSASTTTSLNKPFA